MTLGFRDLRGAGTDTGFKKGTFVRPTTSVQQVERVITAAVAAPGQGRGRVSGSSWLTRSWRSGRRASAGSPRLPDPVTRRCELGPASFRSVPVGRGCGACHVEGEA